MKIKAENAITFVSHLDALMTLQKKSGDANQPTGLGLHKKLRRLETKASRIATALCNGDITDKAGDKALQKIEDKVHELGFSGFFINRDPRGYALKVREALVPSGMQKDWGGYGILAPEF